MSTKAKPAKTKNIIPQQEEHKPGKLFVAVMLSQIILIPVLLVLISLSGKYSEKKESTVSVRGDQELQNKKLDNSEEVAQPQQHLQKEGSTCYDSDGGYSPYEKGSVYWLGREGEEKSTQDICNGGKFVMEAVCDNNGYSYNGDTFVCPYGCLDGICSECDFNGNCVSDEYLRCFIFQDEASCASANCKWSPDENWLDGHCEPLVNPSPSVCTKNNACKFRTPGSGYRCNAAGDYGEPGNHWCECSNDCEVLIR